jgi:hypothetical protein
MSASRALIIGDGPSYHSVANFDWGSFDGLVVSTHFYRQRAGAVVTIDPRRFQEKERHAIGKGRLVVALSHWGNEIGLKRFVPRRFHKDVEWAWCTHPVLTSGVYAIEWAAQQGCKEIYTMGVDLTPGYHKRLDTQRSLLARTLSALDAKGVRVYKRSPLSTLPVPVRDPAEHLPEGVPRPGPAPSRGSVVAPLRSRPSPTVAPRRFRRQRPAPPAAPERRVLLRPRNGKPRIVHVSDLPRS